MSSHPPARRSHSRARLGRSIALHLFLTPLALIWLFPLWMMAVFSTMPDNGIFSPGIEMLPHGNFLANFNNLQRDTNFVGAIGISVSVAVTYTFLSVLLTSMAGWALARYQFFGKGMVVAIILGTITLPYAVVLIPQFIMVARDFKLANTWVALIVPPLFNSLGVLFMRQSFSMMPGDLFDAARVEGVKEWRIFLFVALPLARPMLAALAIILFLASWNNYLWPLLINSRPGSMTAPVALGTLIGLTKVSWGGIMAGAVLLTAPMLVVFVLLQRHFVAGIAAGAIK
ncbi:MULTISPECIES: carbohydrate ABC transporter permease [unclassified Mesorhizobium]|uniref:carbohydrate ABC transporter permease n=1 Tax=unclassified Mesorhizobium TaxID=325217 RepID=UPI000FDC4D80|nr:MULTISPECIES: carbohydrate ABC transporter permease [unclassified Mesorhizobium]TGQ35030.1 carbohydrate ABC transporter permease [Mesorhizobium sp. M00.F.Ca.ET.216.01.1.1]TIS54832.1 MAG: ABC transporter permease subunit [Mesorhizobium sp.]TIS86958.1 MAG: ABC transporter permease subunit [Mesorhizobium sp.]TJW09190.1 MAG: ABC transporter permease subunit [Mesorhizobium sp.]TJW45450.1 MAG: ABC transporter permease subunit [Mesorhizobium sp.]